MTIKNVSIGETQKHLQPFALGLVQIATTATLRTPCLDTSASVADSMSQLTLPWCYPIPVGSTATGRSTTAAHTATVTSIAIQEAAHLVGSLCLSAVIVVRRSSVSLAN